MTHNSENIVESTIHHEFVIRYEAVQGTLNCLDRQVMVWVTKFPLVSSRNIPRLYHPSNHCLLVFSI